MSLDESKPETLVKRYSLDDPKGILDVKIYELNELKAHLDQLMRFLDFVEFKVEIIEHKKRELHKEFNRRTQSFHEKKSEVDFSGATPSQISFQLNIIERDIEQLKNVFEDDIISMNNTKLELIQTLENLIYTMEDELTKIKSKFDEIAEATIALPSDAVQEYTKIVEELQGDIELLDELQDSGWTNKNIYHKMDAYFNNFGLMMDHEGILMTQDQKEKLTFTEAEKRGYFTDINERLASLESLIPKAESPVSVETTSTPEDVTITPSSLFSDVTDADMQYLKEAVGTPLTLALAEITAKQPRDPIHYLAHFLLKYRYNTTMSRLQQKQIEQLNAERETIFKAKWQKFVLEEARKTLMELLDRVEYEVYLRELERLQKEIETEHTEEHSPGAEGLAVGETTGIQALTFGEKGEDGEH